MENLLERIDEVIDRLLYRTKHGDLRWKEGIRPSSFQADFPSYSVIIYGPSGLDLDRPDDPRAYSLRVLDKRGDSVPIEDEMNRNPMSDQTFLKVKDLFSFVQTSRPSVDRAIKKLLQELN